MKVTQDQINEWKAQHGEDNVWKLPVEEKTAYLRSPNMQDWKRAYAAMNKGGEVGFGEAMLNILFIGGDREVIEVDDYFTPARKRLVDFFEYEDAEVTPGKGKNSIITINGNSCEVRIITRDDLKIAERKNPASKPFVTQEKLFEMVCVSKDDVFNDRNNAEIRFPLYKAIEELQNQKVARLEKC